MCVHITPWHAHAPLAYGFTIEGPTDHIQGVVGFGQGLQLLIPVCFFLFLLELLMAVNAR